MGYREFDKSSINYTVRIWIQSPEQPDYWKVRNAAIIAIKKAYDKHNIAIPFPIRTLDFDGQSLTSIQPEK